MKQLKRFLKSFLTRNTLPFCYQQKDEENTLSIPHTSMQVKHVDRWKHFSGYLVNMITCLILLKGFDYNVFFSADVFKKRYPKYNMVHLWLSSSFMHGYIFTMIPVKYCLSEFSVRQVIASAATMNCASLILCVIGCKEGTRIFVLLGQIISSVGFWTMLTVTDFTTVLWYKEIKKNAANVIVVFINALFTLISFMQVNDMWSYQSNNERNFRRLKEHCFVSLAFTAMFLVLAAIKYDEKKKVLPERILSPKKDQSNVTCNDKSLLTSGRFLLFQSYAIFYALSQTNSIMLQKIILTSFPEIKESTELTDLEIVVLIGCICSLYPASVLLIKLDRFRTINFVLHVYVGSSILLIVLILFHTTSFLGLCFIYANLGIYSLIWSNHNNVKKPSSSCVMSDQVFSTTILVGGNSYGFVFTILLTFLTSYEKANIGKYGFVCLYLVSCAFAVVTGKKKDTPQFLK